MKIFYSVGHVSFVLLFLLLFINSGLFDTVQTECGLSYYAENLTKWELTVRPLLSPHTKVDITLPKWMPMPANTLVNIGYILVGLLMLKQWYPDEFTGQKYYAYVLAWMSVVYGPIQFIRIVTQSQRSAVLDQWITLVFFSWAVIWYMKLYQRYSVKNRYFYTTLYILSLFSYFATLFSRIGFDVVLAIHMVIALSAAIHLVVNFGSRSIRRNFVCFILSCSGFVLLKVFDMQLAALPAFSLLTGHFWSKVCDCLQIYYASALFMQVESMKCKTQ